MEKETESKKFWEAVEKVVGKVNTHIRTILSLQGLVANKALGTLTLEDINEIEEDMRSRAGLIKVNLTKKAEIYRLSEYYGMYSESPEDFRFSFGDKRVIEMIAQAIQDKGIQWFQRETAGEIPDDGTHLSGQISMEIDAENLIKRLRYRFSEKGINNIHLNLLDGVEVEVKKASGGRRQGIVKCPICGGKRNVMREPNQSWKTFNIERHVQLHSKARSDGSTCKRSQIMPCADEPEPKRQKTTMPQSVENEKIVTTPARDPLFSSGLNWDATDPKELPDDSMQQKAYSAANAIECSAYEEERIDDPLDENLTYDRTADGNDGEYSGYDPGVMEDRVVEETNEGDESESILKHERTRNIENYRTVELSITLD